MRTLGGSLADTHIDLALLKERVKRRDQELADQSTDTGEQAEGESAEASMSLVEFRKFQQFRETVKLVQEQDRLMGDQHVSVDSEGVNPEPVPDLPERLFDEDTAN